jgi:hypothetical protein
VWNNNATEQEAITRGSNFGEIHRSEKMLIIIKIDTQIIIVSNKGTFLYKAPITLKIRTAISASNKDIKVRSIFKFRKMFADSFLLNFHSIKSNTKVTHVSVMVMNIVDKGLLNPEHRKALFKIKLRRIVIARLDPTEKIMTSKRSSLFKFKILRSVYPEMKDNQRKPSTCLNIEISNKMDNTREKNNRITVFE